MMHHQGGAYHIERLIRERKLLNHPDLEFDGLAAPGCFGTGTSDLLLTWVNACDATRCANLAGHVQQKCARPATHIQHCLAGLHLGQGDRSLPEMAKPSTEREGVVDPCQEARSANLLSKSAPWSKSLPPGPLGSDGDVRTYAEQLLLLCPLTVRLS